MSDEKPERWEKIGDALFRLPTPPPSERFVRTVMARIQQEDRSISWLGLWKIPAMGVALAGVLFAVVTFIQTPSMDIYDSLAAAWDDPVVSHWIVSDEAPNRDEILEFTLEDL